MIWFCQFNNSLAVPFTTNLNALNSLMVKLPLTLGKTILNVVLSPKNKLIKINYLYTNTGI
jgi:hypothetical protein